MTLQASDALWAALPSALGWSASAWSRERKPCPTERSPYQPPGWVFGVAWATLYALMGVAAALYWRANGRRIDAALVTFLVGAVGLQAWWLRFGRACGQQRQAFRWIVALAVAHATVAASFARTSPIAGALLVPLVAWLSFASFLVRTTRSI